MTSNGHISYKLLQWYELNKRPLPWRNTRDPYVIWLSEILLQQTRVAQGLPYFERFLSRYPRVSDLASAPLDEVLKLWQGLGYYSRAHNLHQTAKKIISEFDGKFPYEYHKLITLKGIGAYTAAAISSISSGEKQAVVDGNVYRVLSRLYGIEQPINHSSAFSQFQKLSLELMNGHDSGTYNQAVMELGAMICTPRNPQCHSCPIVESCFAHKHNQQSDFPKKLPTKAKSNRFLNYVVQKHKGRIQLIRRDMDDIWKGMYQPLLMESDKLLSLQEVESFLKDSRPGHISQFPDLVHLLTHRKLHIRFFLAEVEKPTGRLEEIWIIPSELAFFALPKPIADFFRQFGEEI